MFNSPKKYKKSTYIYDISAFILKLFPFAFARCFGFFLPSNAGFFIMFMSSYISHHPRFLATPFKTAQGTV